MRNYQKQYTFQKELRFLVLFAIKKLTEKLNARGKLEVQDNPVPLHSIAEKLQENKKTGTVTMLKHLLKINYRMLLQA